MSIDVTALEIEPRGRVGVVVGLLAGFFHERFQGIYAGKQVR